MIWTGYLILATIVGCGLFILVLLYEYWAWMGIGREEDGKSDHISRKLF